MPIDLSKVAKCKIHPAIGIARVGNHPTEFFIGPETRADTTFHRLSRPHPRRDLLPEHPQ